jgi:hypothetical protein
MSAFENNKMWYSGPSKNVDPGSRSHSHPKAPPAPDPVKLETSLSLLGGEKTSTPVSKFSSDDAVDPYPCVKRFSATADRNECKQLLQVQVILAAMDRRTQNALTYHHIKDLLIALKTIRSNLINEKLSPVVEISKQWNHQKIWKHIKSFLFYSGDTNDLMKPAEEWGEKWKSLLDVTSLLSQEQLIRLKPSHQHWKDPLLL